MTDERIAILKELLLELHHGTPAEAIQERFNATFTGVSALEISLMEHELMSSDTGITFEDVMKLCNVHANLFKGVIADVDVADSDQEGHPVYVFKQENLALRAALLRIRRILEQWSEAVETDFQEQLLKGLKHQLALLGQFEHHYDRKENLFFPMMEKYGHDAPPKVMWGVDDEIRELFQEVLSIIENQADFAIEQLILAFETFAKEFEEMIFKEEAILLMILLETLTQDDWLAIARDSDSYGYAIIKPTAVWTPVRDVFVESKPQDNPHQHVIDLPEGQLQFTFTPKNTASFDSQQPLPFGNGYLTIEQANLILNHLPFEITFVNKDDIFQYYNDSTSADEMIFKRLPSQIGRHVDLCHPPKLLEKVRTIFDLLKSGKREQFEMWFKSQKTGQFVYVVYKAVRNQSGDFEGVLEYVQDIQPFFELDGDVKRDLD